MGESLFKSGSQGSQARAAEFGGAVYPHLALDWFAVMVKPRFEKSTALLLQQKGYENFLPLTVEIRNWSDRKKSVELPLFPRYLFCRLDLQHQVPVLNTPGVQRIVGFGLRPTPIPEHEIESVRKVVQYGGTAIACDYLAAGQSVRVCDGPLTGVEGLLVKVKDSCRVVVSIHLLQRSVYAEVDRSAVTPLSPLPVGLTPWSVEGSLARL